MSARVLNGRQFIADLNQADKEAGELSLKFQKRIALEALRRLVNRTPVDTGRARGGWQVRQTIASENDNGNIDTGGGSTITAGLSIINRVRIPFGVIVIFNNVEYIVFLEEGSSSQAPQGMVALTILDLNRIAAAAGFQDQFKFTVD